MKRWLGRIFVGLSTALAVAALVVQLADGSRAESYFGFTHVRMGAGHPAPKQEWTWKIYDYPGSIAAGF